MDLGLGGHYYSKSEEFEACFVFVLQLRAPPPPMPPWEGLFLSPDALSHIMTPVMQQRDSRLFIKMGFFDYFCIVHVQKHSLLRSKTPVCEIWWLLVERIVTARTG